MIVKYLLCVAGGIGLGYALAHSQLEQRYFEGHNAGFEEARDYYKDCSSICAERDQKLMALTDEEFAKTPESVKLVKGAAEKLAEEYSPVSTIPEVVTEKASDILPREKPPAVNYNKISTPDPVDEKKSDEKSEEPADVPPYLIDFETFDENAKGYRQRVLTYFAEDSEVADESDVKLPKQMVGQHISYSNLAKLSEENPTIYVRSDTHHVDYEICYYSGHSEEVAVERTG